MSDEQNAPDSEMPPEIEALHPFILEVCAHLIPGTEGERYWISAEDAIDIHAGLLEYEGDDELAHIIHGLGAMAVAMEGPLNSPSLAAQIVAILESEELQKIFTALKVAQSPETLAAAAKRFSDFADATSAKAPGVNEPRPEGTLTLDAMKFPKRL